MPSPPPTLFVVMLSKAHLISHSRLSGSRWWSHRRDYLGREDRFCTVLLCILAISSSYLLLLLGSYHFCPYRAHLCMKCSFGISGFLEEIPSLSHSVVFLYFFALIAEEGFLVSFCCSLELCIQMFISFLFWAWGTLVPQSGTRAVRAPCIGGSESQPLDCWGGPRLIFVTFQRQLLRQHTSAGVSLTRIWCVCMWFLGGKI